MDEEDEEDLSWGNRCSPRWWNSCCRLFRCPCARPKTVKPPKNPSDLHTISLTVPLTQETEQKRPDNVVITSKYTIWTFVPMATALQFRRAVNVFYLFQVILLVIGYYYPNIFSSPYSPFGTLMILIFVIAVTLIFEGRDDVQRHRTDRIANSTKVSIVYPENGARKKTTWGNLRPGSLVVLRNREMVPADVVVIETSDPGARVYIETSGIDGETNLKIRTVGPEMKRYIRNAPAAALSTANSSSAMSGASESGPSTSLGEDSDSIDELLRNPSTIEEAAQKMQGTFEYEEPNPFLQFSGRFIPNAPENAAGDKPKAIPIGFESVLLRGSEVRNTKWLLAVVVYAGHETKLVLSKKDTPSKFSMMDLLTNNLIYLTFLELLIMNIIAVVVLFLWAPNTETIWYFDFTDSLDVFTIPGWLAYFFTFNILLANVVPISLYVIVEIATFAQGFFVDNDIEMYDEASDTPAKARTGNLISEIGQITHLFSDKTGTLTQNVMSLIGAAVGGTRYGIGSRINTDGYDSASSATSNEPLMKSPGVQTKDSEPLLLSQEDKVRWHFRGLIKELDYYYKETKEGRGLAGESDAKRRIQKIEDFLIFLAVCHTVIIDYDDEGSIRYNAEGPDEEALVKAAAALGYVLTATDDAGYRVENLRSGHVSQYKVIAVNGFTSDRKRMSIIVRKSNITKSELSIDAKDDAAKEEYKLFMKGADNVMFERLKEEYSSPATSEQCVEREMMIKDLTYFAEFGFRTLVMCAKTITDEEFNAWMTKYQQAKQTPGNQRRVKMDEVADLIERDCDLVGASSIEDALQKGVPDTIDVIRQAGINVWVLTGDKLETAINIGFSAKLLDREMFQIILDEEDPDKLNDAIDKTLSVLESLALDARKQPDAKPEEENTGAGAGAGTDVDDTQSSSLRKRGPNLKEAEEGRANADEVQQPAENPEDPKDRPIEDLWDTQQELALIVTGKALELLLAKQKGNKQTEAKFVSLARACTVVIACRVSPSQKALIVRSVMKAPGARRTKRPITLAIGDGANDVAMIQEARVGVGISGMEGRQAVNNSDFSIAQFRFLQRLLLVHGRWNYRRNARLLLFVCYSYQVLNFLLFGYMFLSMVSGQQVYSNTYYVTLYAWYAGPLATGFAWFDKDISAKTALEFPMSYSVGRNNEDLAFPRLVGMLARSLIHSAIAWVAVFYVALPLWNNDIAVLGSASYMAVVWTVLCYQFMTGRTWTWLMFLGVFIILAAYLGLVTLLDVQAEGVALIFTTAAKVSWPAMFWAIFTMIAFEHLVVGSQVLFRPSPIDILIEADALPHYMPANAFRAMAQGRRILLPVEKIRAAMTKKSASTRKLVESQKHPTGYLFDNVGNGGS